MGAVKRARWTTPPCRHMRGGLRCHLAARHPQELHEGSHLLTGREARWTSLESDELAKEE